MPIFQIMHRLNFAFLFPRSYELFLLRTPVLTKQTGDASAYSSNMYGFSLVSLQLAAFCFSFPCLVVFQILRTQVLTTNWWCVFLLFKSCLNFFPVRRLKMRFLFIFLPILKKRCGSGLQRRAVYGTASQRGWFVESRACSVVYCSGFCSQF